MSLYSRMQQIMDLSNPISEANKKLLETYMVVNGEVVLIKEFVYDSDKVIVKKSTKLQEIKVESIDVFLPESGIYRLDNDFRVLITKVPKRQWCKSFSSSYYNWVFLSGKQTSEWLTELYKNLETRSDITLIKDKFYYWDKMIGYIKSSKTKSSVVCEDLNFKQELVEYINDC
jgi:hypothetical protein